MPIKNAFFFHDDKQGLGKNRSVIQTGMKHKKWAKLSLISTIHSFQLTFYNSYSSFSTICTQNYLHTLVKNADNKSLNPKKPKGGGGTVCYNGVLWGQSGLMSEATFIKNFQFLKYLIKLRSKGCLEKAKTTKVGKGCLKVSFFLRFRH